MDFEQKLGDFCLICFSKVDRSKLPKQSGLLSNNLNVIFLLRNLLQVPSELLIGNFKKCGSPFYWISLCENCSQLTSQAMEHHLQILKLVNQLRSVLKIITDKIRESSETLTFYQDDIGNDKKKSMQEKRLHILKRTRDFVTNYDYNIHLVNPFIEGDKLARTIDGNEDTSSSDGSGEEMDWQMEYGGGDDEGTEASFVDKEHEEITSHRQDIHKINVAGMKSSGLRPPKKKHVEVDGKWKCRYCEKLFLSTNAVCAHEKEKHPSSAPGNFVCKICGKTWNSKSYLSGHIIRSHKANVRKPVTVRANEVVHLEVDGKWKCRYCDKVFKSRAIVLSHEKNLHLQVPGQFICDICGKTWNTKSYLRLHRKRIHKVNAAGEPVTYTPAKGKPCSCHLCGKTFSSTNGLTIHLKHFHEKRYKVWCHVCGKGMYSKYSLNMHLLQKHEDDPETIKLIEEGARIWKCEVKGCKGTYSKESGLEEHMKNVHGGGGEEQEGNKRFSCAFCGKTFWYWFRLQCHENLHKLGTEKPFSCDICGAKFRTVYGKRRHKRRFHLKMSRNDC